MVRQRLEARLEQRWRAQLCTRVEVASIIAVHDDDMPLRRNQMFYVGIVLNCVLDKYYTDDSR